MPHKVLVDGGRLVVHDACQLVQLQLELRHVRHVLHSQVGAVHEDLEKDVGLLLRCVHEQEPADEGHALAVAHLLVYHAVGFHTVEERLLPGLALEKSMAWESPSWERREGGGDVNNMERREGRKYWGGQEASIGRPFCRK